MESYLIITGASKGIGFATAKHFHAQGWRIINISRSRCDIPEADNFSIDLSNLDWQLKWQSHLRQSIKHPARICLVHNAAFYHEDTITQLKLTDLNLSLAVNVIAPVLLNQIFIDQMTTGSSIIYIGSTLSEKAVKNKASYIISKHALAGLMKASCEDLATYQDKIHTCCVCPGFTKTEMVIAHTSKKDINLIKQLVAAHRLIEPDEVAKFVYFCAHNPILNGAMLHANLGQLNVA